MEKRKIILVDTDPEYMIRLFDYAKRKMPKVELACFKDIVEAALYAQEQEPDLFVLSTAFEKTPPRFEKPIKTAWLFRDAQEGKTRRGVFQYQRAGDLLTKLCEISELPYEYEKKNTKVLAFLPCAGEVGVSTIASAGCIHFSRKAERVLYFNMQQFGHLNEVFCKPSPWGMKNIDEAIEAVSENPFEILQTLVCAEAGNIYSCDCFTNPLEASGADFSQIERLLQTIVQSGLFDVILVDCDLIFDRRFSLVLSSADKVVLVGDGSGLSNSKIQAVCTLLSKLSEERGISYPSKCCLLYNKYVEGESRKCESKTIQDIGGVFLQSDGAKATIIKKIAAMNLFDRLLENETEERHA